MGNILDFPAVYCRRSATLDRLREERQACIDFVTRTVEQAEADNKRDLSDTEQQTLETQKKRIAQLDAQIKPLDEFEQIRAASEQTVRKYSSTGPELDDKEQRAGGLGGRTELREHQYRTRGEVIVDIVAQRPGEYRSLSGTRSITDDQKRAARDRLMGAGVRFPDAPVDYLQRIANQTTADTPGLLPKPIIGAVDSDLDGSRPFVQSIGAKDLGAIPGQSFSRPVVTQHTEVGKQSSEKAELPSRQLKVGGIDFKKETYGGSLDVSRQDIDWTSPAAWDAILADLQDVYGIATENVAAEAFAGAIDQTVPAPATNDLKGWATAIYEAAALAYGGSRRLPNHMWVSLDMWAQMGAVVDVARRSFRRGDADGSQTPTSFEGQVLDLPRTVVPSFPDGTVIVGDRTKTEFYEERIGFLQAVEPRLLGVEIAYGGYVAYGTLRPLAFARVGGGAVNPGNWAATTEYEVGDQVTLAGGAVLQAAEAGTSGATAPAAPAAVGDDVVDGTVLWERIA